MSIKKERVDVPSDVASDVMYQSDSTCCVCSERGRPVQLHHIDENPSNNDKINLAVVCLLCHDDTQIKGGFGRKLNPALVTKYRDEWVIRVASRRQKADEVAAVNFSKAGDQSPIGDYVRQKVSVRYIQQLPKLRANFLAECQPQWDTGVTSTMIEATSSYIDAIQAILVTLASYYPTYHFAGQDPRRYFASLIASRYLWHSLHTEPNGTGTGGTFVRVLRGGGVMQDVDNMVDNMVCSLSMDLEKTEFDITKWQRAWNKK